MLWWLRLAQTCLAGPGVPIKGARCLLQPFCSVAMSALSQKSARVSFGFVKLAGIWRAKGAFGGNAGLQRATGGFSCMPWQRRNLKFLGDDEGCLSEQTVSWLAHYHISHSTKPCLVRLDRPPPMAGIRQGTNRRRRPGVNEWEILCDLISIHIPAL
jgi:hypothetical protein